jgi:hypothetical protein
MIEAPAGDNKLLSFRLIPETVEWMRNNREKLSYRIMPFRGDNKR